MVLNEYLCYSNFLPKYSPEVDVDAIATFLASYKMTNWFHSMRAFIFRSERYDKQFSSCFLFFVDEFFFLPILPESFSPLGNSLLWMSSFLATSH